MSDRSRQLLNTTCVEADLDRPDHQQAVLDLVEAFSMDAMGNSRPLDQNVRANLIPGLRKHPTTLIFLAFEGECPIGAAICFLGFSTFAAKPLVNVHDCIVVPTHRGKGVGRRLLDEVEAKARHLGCCKLILQVMDDNHRALKTYRSAGFKQSAGGRAIFMTKSLT